MTGVQTCALPISYSPGKTIEYYIRAAGGPTQKADVKRSYVTQPNGKVEARQGHFLLPDGIPKPLPGSTVYVPARDPNDRPTDLLSNFGTIASLLTGLATVILAVRH